MDLKISQEILNYINNAMRDLADDYIYKLEQYEAHNPVKSAALERAEARYDLIKDILDETNRIIKNNIDNRHIGGYAE